MVKKKTASIVLNFILKDEDGTILDDTYGRTPMKFIPGESRMPPGFEKEVLAMRPDEAGKKITIPPELGYGERKKELVVRIHKSELPEGITYEVGKRYRRFDEHLNSRSFEVTGYIDDWVVLDGNHPWAGKTLMYETRIIAIQQD